MVTPIKTLAFDADDTLWHNERSFRMSHYRFAELLSDHSDVSDLMGALDAAERRNLGRYGFGVKAFVLSMIETAIEVTEERVPASVIRQLIEAGNEMLEHPIELLPGVREALETLSETHRLFVITKGDLLDQERKLAQSGLGDLFEQVEVVSDKSTETYATILKRHGLAAQESVMIGNSLRSDVIPMLEIGGWGVYVPHEHTWSYEHADEPSEHPRYRQIDTLDQLVPLLGLL